MVRIIAFLVGLGFCVILLISMVTNLVGYVQSPPEPTVEHEFHKEPKELHLASNGPLGHWDKQQLQRGFQVYKEVCAGCHSLERVAFRNLAELGYSEAEVKAIANQWPAEVASINPETGEPATRKAIPSDRFPSPYANETAGRAANNNAYPPDLSLITKAREGGAPYVYSLLTGYADAATYRNEKGKAVPAANRPSEALHFNPYFANLNIAMPQPITSEGQVSYADGTKPTVDQMAKDVSAFLVWTAEPNLQARHRAGIAVLIFLIVATMLGYLSYQHIWAEAKRKVAPVGPLDPVNKAKRKSASKKAGVTE